MTSTTGGIKECTRCRVKGRDSFSDAQWKLPLSSPNRCCNNCYPFSQIVFYTKKNRKQKYLLTSNDNFFAGVRIPWVMVDTGCSSLLLPLADGDLNYLVGNFPPLGCVWRIGGSVGVGVPNSLTLILRHALPDTYFKIRLHGTKLKSSYLRFHLCYEDAKVATFSSPLIS